MRCNKNSSSSTTTSNNNNKTTRKRRKNKNNKKEPKNNNPPNNNEKQSLGKIGILVVGTSPVRNYFATCSFSSCAKQSQSPDNQLLKSEATDSPAHYDSPAPPPLLGSDN